MPFDFDIRQLDHILLPLRDYVLPIILYFLVAYIVARKSDSIARRLRPLGEISLSHMPQRYERLQTIRALFASAIRLGSFLIAILLTLGRFVSSETLVWSVGLFSAAFGLGARPFISDFLTGIMLIFEDTYDVGDKVEIPVGAQLVEGVVEAVDLRITRVRGMGGELYTMPNGEIRLVRNFSRGQFSLVRVTLDIPAKDLAATLDTLEALGTDAMTRLPNLIEPWQVISEAGTLGETVELTVLAKAKFGKGAELKTRMLAWLQGELDQARITDSHDVVDD